MYERKLIIEGARQNNLKNINLTLPHNKVIVITGVSGSGKSSLAFDTIFAEGQWRFIESLSTYARLFLEKLDRPDVDAIHNIKPAIALEQKNTIRGSRSTVGTLTEIYDLFRVLYAKIARPFCLICGKEIKKWNPSQIVSELINKHSYKKAIIAFETKESVESLKKRGFYRFWLNGEIRENYSGLETGDFKIVILDRLTVGDKTRLSDSIEMAWKEGEGKIRIIFVDSSKGPCKPYVFSSKNECEECSNELPQPSPLLFSFNHPVGACPDCKGFGNILQYDEDLIIPDKRLSLSEGAIDPWNKPAYRWWQRQLIKGAIKEGIDINKPYAEFTEKERGMVFKGGRNFYGINDFFEDMETRKYKLHIRVFLSRYRRPVTCLSCSGKRLRKEALAYRISGIDIAELCNMPVSDIIKFFRRYDLSSYEAEIAKEILRQIDIKLGFLKRVGLDYLSLNRDSRTLSGGEYQRVNLANQLASFLTGTLYVLDEPTIGLHARDVKIIADIMSELSGLGNTILVVEHDRSIINSADWIVELGPGGGSKGGEVIFSGKKDEFLKSNTLTAQYIKGIKHIEPPLIRRKGSGERLMLYGAKGNNLKSIDFGFPLQEMVTVTGVSGSGKSSLVVDTLYKALAMQIKKERKNPLPYKKIEGVEFIKDIKLIDQSPIGKSPRSNPVTYLKIFGLIRNLLSEQTEARAYRYEPGFFSFNVPGGRCEACKGAGYQKMEMYFFEDMYIKCEKCNGKRYREEALRVTYRNRNVNDILNMTVSESIDFFSDIPKIKNRLLIMEEIGLGYLKLGQPATTLSGGEAQRIKICAEIVDSATNKVNKNMKQVTDKGILYILDEPTIGLHFNDIKALLNVLKRLVVAGNTVLIIEHNLDVIMASDWIIDLGPEGGERGGRIVFEGTPEDILYCKESYTGKSLKEYFSTLLMEKSV